MSMRSQRTRQIILLISLLLIVGGLLAVGYAMWPLASSSITETLPPTLFVPPPAP